MNVLITGSTGFLGSKIINELIHENHKITTLNRAKSKASIDIELIGDLNNFDKIKPTIIELKPDVVMHLAWEGIPDFSKSISIRNLNNSIRFLDFVISETNCKKIIVSGSCWEYGKKKGICKEEDPVIIDSYFAWAKYALNQFLLIKCDEKNVILNWFRIFYVYGPGQRKKSLIPSIIKSINDKKPLKINSPLNKNDFIFVDDIAHALVSAVNTNLKSGIYNLGSGKASSVYDICSLIERSISGQDTLSKQLLKNIKQNQILTFWADMEKTNEALNMSFNTSLDEGIKKCIDAIITK